MLRPISLFTRVLFLTLLLVVSPASLSSETTKKKEGVDSSSLSLFQKKTLEYALLEYGMLENRRQQGMNENLQSQLVFVLERLVEVYCMPDLPKTLEYVGPATGEQCLHHLEELELMHAENPVALCARHGIDSDSCRDAYDNQYITNYFQSFKNAKNKIEDSTDFLVRLNVPAESELAKVDTIFAARAKFESKPTPENRKNFEKVLSLRIRTDCNPSYYRLSFEKPNDTWIASFHEKERVEDPLQQLVNAFSVDKSELSLRGKGSSYPGRSSAQSVDQNSKGAVAAGDYSGLSTKKEVDTGEKFLKGWRVRYLSKACEPTLRAAFTYDKNYADAICYREGFTAYRCVQALRARRERIIKAQKRVAKELQKSNEPKEPLSGFDSF
jgi:hypothetical protein